MQTEDLISNIHPEVLMFLTKIRHLSVRIVSNNPTLVDTVHTVSEDLYLELLFFIVKNWLSMFKDSNIKSIPLIKYVASDETQSSFSIHECTQNQTDAKRVVITHPTESEARNWMMFWNNKFSGNCFFMPESTQKAISHFITKYILMRWLEIEVYVTRMNVDTFANTIFSYIKKDSTKLIITYTSFLVILKILDFEWN